MTLLGWSTPPARAQGVPPLPCVVSPIDAAVVDCTGDLAGGVELNNGAGPFTTLNAFALTSDIMPPSGVGGIVFTSDGDVALNVEASPFRILTSGNFAAGLFAESVNGQVSIISVADIATTGYQAHGIAAESDAGNITIVSRGDIQTSADGFGMFDGAFGISAVSLTGDIAIFSDSAISTTGMVGVGIYGETEGTAIVTSNGNITTLGDGAAAIAIAGENGVAVISTGHIVTFGDSAPGITVIADGDAGVIATGDITTTGDVADGISVQSFNGMAVVVSSGAVSATGSGAAGIYVFGDAGAVVMNYGSVVGGPCCAGVMMDSDAFNTLLNWGTITAGLADYAIDLAGPTSAVDNFGTVTGDVIFRMGSGSFTNHVGALFNAGAMVEAGVVTNDGTLAPGGRGSVLLTALGDSFVQSPTGIFAVDVDPKSSGARNDYMIVSDAATLAGNVAITMLSLPSTLTDTFTILTAMGGTPIDEGLGLIASPALHAMLLWDANNVSLGIAVGFANFNVLNPNQRAIAADLERAYVLGGGGLTPVLLGLLNVHSLGEYKSALDQLSPEIYSDAEIAALYASQGFTSSLLSCRVNGADTASIIREGQCLWAGASVRFLSAGTTAQQIGFDERAGLFTAGAQAALDDVWRLGFAAGFQSSTLQTSTGATSEGSLGQAGIALKYNPGPLLLAGALAAGGARYDARRFMSFGGFTGIAESVQTLGIFSATLRAAYVLGTPHLYFKPTLDATLTQLQLGGFTETGSAAALSVEGSGHTVLALTPALEAGTEWWLANGTLVRPQLRTGLVWYADADLALSSSFVDAPLGVGPFVIDTELDEAMALIGAGVEVISAGDAVMRFAYDAQLGSTTQIHAVGIKGSARY